MKLVVPIMLATSAIGLLAGALLAPAQAGAAAGPGGGGDGPISCGSHDGNVYCSETTYGGQRWSYDLGPVWTPANNQAFFSTPCGAQGRSWAVTVTYVIDGWGNTRSASQTGACSQVVT